MQISRKWFEIETWYQLPTNIGNGLWRIEWWRHRWRHVTVKSQGRDPNISQYLPGPLFRKRLEIETRLQQGTYRKWHVRYRMVAWCNRWRHATQKGQSRDLVIFWCKYLENGLRYGLGKNSLGGYMHSECLLVYHAIFGLRRTGVSFIVSVSWSSALLMSGSLQQNVILTRPSTSGEIVWLLACVRADGQHFERLLWASREIKNVMDK